MGTFREGINPQNRVEQLTVSTNAHPYGCCGVFSLCGSDDIISLSLASFNGFLDWLGWETTDLCTIEQYFVDRWLPSEGSRQGWLSDACADPNSVNWGTCAFRIEDFARLRRSAPVQDVTKNHLRLCERQPLYRLDGTRIMDDLEWNLVTTAQVMLQDLMLMVVNGNSATGGQFDGLEQLVTTGYTDFENRRCSAMDSIVIDWNHNTLSGGAGITWTDGRGTRTVAATATITDVLRSVIRELRFRIRNSGLGVNQLRVGDIAIVCTSQMAECLLDSFTCYSVCEGSQYNEANINTLEARAFRESISGGTISANGSTIEVEGFITVHGVRIPVIAYDWGLATGSYSDIYVLTGSVGGRKTLYGQWNDMSPVPTRYRDANKFFTTDGGKTLGYFESDHTCTQPVLEMQPRIVATAPWTLTRITNAECSTPGGELTGDPLSSSFYVGGSSFELAACP